MARHETVTVSGDSWVELTSGDALRISLQALGGYALQLAGTPDATPPTADAAHCILPPRVLVLNQPLSDLCPGVSGVARLWGRCTPGVAVYVSHA